MILKVFLGFLVAKAKREIGKKKKKREIGSEDKFTLYFLGEIKFILILRNGNIFC